MKWQQDTIRDYLIEMSKPHENRNPELIMKYRYEIMENGKLEQELSLGTPIIAQIKTTVDHNSEVLQPSE